MVNWACRADLLEQHLVASIGISSADRDDLFAPDASFESAC